MMGTRTGASHRKAAELGTHQARVGALVALIAVGALAVVTFWWFDTTSVVGLGAWLTNAGRVTGLLAGYAVAVLLVLMSRAPSLERGIGSDNLARLHAHGGRYTVSLIAAHAALITWGYSVTAHTNVLHQTSSLLLSYPDVLMATVAGALFVGVGVLSARAARAKLRYETWYHLHVYTYLAVALAFSHQFSTGADFVDNLWARVIWSTMYIAAASLIVWFRIVVPIHASLRHRMRVIDVRPEADGVVSIVMRGHHLDELRAESGQFFRWRFLTHDGWWQSHPFSLSAPPHREYLRITVKRLGDHSTDLQLLRIGTRVFVEGPYGAMTAARRRRRKVLLIAGGVGITPLRALFESMPAAPGELAMIVRANRDEDIVFRDELDQIAVRRGADLRYAVGPPGVAGDPFVADRLLSLYPDLANRDIYLCGPPAFMSAVTDRLRHHRVPGRQVHRESFAF